MKLSSSGNSIITLGYGGLSKIVSSVGPEYDTNHLDFYVHDDLTMGLTRNYNSGINSVFVDGKVGITTTSPSATLSLGTTSSNVAIRFRHFQQLIDTISTPQNMPTKDLGLSLA